ncbi:hypothetical protein JW977_00430 [Candidatus Falkowbacteria bacterium]|nr:hypothetical protein [Candidatus Falkowbacteria bacterium]
MKKTAIKKGKRINMASIKMLMCLLVFSLTLVLAHQVIGSMESTNFQIWVDSFGSGGGAGSSTSYKMGSSMTTPSGPMGTSANFGEISGFTPIEDEPTVGFSVQAASLNFGVLSPSSTAYASHTFSAYTNSEHGYKIKIFGEPLHSADHAIVAIGATPEYAAEGSEQFGINLASNTAPLVGLSPIGGSGTAQDKYNQTNKFAYVEGDIIALAPSFSYQTNYTASIIANISQETTAGLYQTTLIYEFIPIF